MKKEKQIKITKKQKDKIKANNLDKTGSIELAKALKDVQKGE